VSVLVNHKIGHASVNSSPTETERYFQNVTGSAKPADVSFGLSKQAAPMIRSATIAEARACLRTESALFQFVVGGPGCAGGALNRCSRFATALNSTTAATTNSRWSVSATSGAGLVDVDLARSLLGPVCS
jgi:hypothetical protein